MSWPIGSDYLEAIQNPNSCFNDVELQNGIPEIGLWGVPKFEAGSFAVVFQINCGNRKYAVKCFTKYYEDQEQRYSIISNHLKQTELPFIINFDFLKEGIKVKGDWYPILKMEWVHGDQLHEYIQGNLNHPNVLYNLSKQFFKLIGDLKQYSIAHGDLQHRNIIIVDSEIRLIDYDGMFVPGLLGMSSHEIGHPNYQHPKRGELDFNLELDNFSAWVIYISLILLSHDPSLWHKLKAGDEKLLFCHEDFVNPDSSYVLSELNRTQNSTIYLLTTWLKSLFSLDMSQIPALVESQFDIRSEPTSKNIDWLSEHIQSHQQDVGIPNSQLTSGDSSSWIVDYMQPLPTVSMSKSYVTERICLTAFLLTVAGAFYSTYIGLTSLVIFISAISYGFFLMTLYFWIKYMQIPEVRTKRILLSKRKAVQKDITGLEKSIKALEIYKSSLSKKSNQTSDGLLRKQNKYAEWESKEILKIEQALTHNLAKIHSERSNLSKREKEDLNLINQELQRLLTIVDNQKQNILRQIQAEISRELNLLKDQIISQHLIQYDLLTADIHGIGTELKRRLLANGIKTASDIVKVTIYQSRWGNTSKELAYIEVRGKGAVHIDGIGPKKANALSAWHNKLISRLNVGVPKSLSFNQEASIRSKYKHQIDALDVNESNLNRDATDKIRALKSRYQALYSDLDIRENEAKNIAKQKKDGIYSRFEKEKEFLAKSLQNTHALLKTELTEIEIKITEGNRKLPQLRWDLAIIGRELDQYQAISFLNYFHDLI